MNQERCTQGIPCPREAWYLLLGSVLPIAIVLRGAPVELGEVLLGVRPYHALQIGGLSI